MVYTAEGTLRKRQIVIFLTSLLILLSLIRGLFWFFGTGVITINVENSSNQKLTYKILNQKTDKTTTIETSSTSIKKFMPKGTYEVSTGYAENSYFSVITVKKMLGKTIVSAMLQPEKARTFIGNEPQPCMYYDQTMLITSTCSGVFDELVAHLPANDQSPTVVSNQAYSLANFTFGGIVWLNNKRYLFAQGSHGDTPDVKHSLVETDEKLKTVNSIELAGLGENRNYHIKNYRDGFLIYDNTFANLKYYISPSSNPETITIEPPRDNNMRAISLDTYKDKIAVFYSGEPQDQEFEHDKDTPAKTSSKVVQVFENGKTRSVVLGNGSDFSSTAILCGDARLCYKNGQELSVIDLSAGKQVTAFKIGDAQSIIFEESTIYIKRSGDILGVDASTGTGAIQYSRGEYTSFCGMQAAWPTGFILCVRDKKNRSSALFVSPNNINKDSIDKKVLKLSDKPYIKVVSAYKNYIYIVPELGPSLYNIATNDYRPSPGVQQKASDDINNLVNDTGIDRSIYKIINTNP
jgi:hypothetical protein